MSSSTNGACINRLKETHAFLLRMQELHKSCLVGERKLLGECESPEGYVDYFIPSPDVDERDRVALKNTYFVLSKAINAAFKPNANLLASIKNVL
jgi:hypothetical protein